MSQRPLETVPAAFSLFKAVFDAAAFLFASWARNGK
jgi:hypothetical protein